jgi:hypothetical protein
VRLELTCSGGHKTGCIQFQNTKRKTKGKELRKTPPNPVSSHQPGCTRSIRHKNTVKLENLFYRYTIRCHWMSAFRRWEATQFAYVWRYRTSEHLETSFPLKINKLRYFETSGAARPVTQRHIPTAWIPQCHITAKTSKLLPVQGHDKTQRRRGTIPI